MSRIFKKSLKLVEQLNGVTSKIVEFLQKYSRNLKIPLEIKKSLNKIFKKFQKNLKNPGNL